MFRLKNLPQITGLVDDIWSLTKVFLKVELESQPRKYPREQACLLFIYFYIPHSKHSALYITRNTPSPCQVLLMDYSHAHKYI